MKPQMLSVMVAVGFVAGIAGSVRADDKPRHGQTAMNVRYDGAFNGTRGSNVIGANVKNSAGKDLGEIEDVVVDPQSGRVAYAVLQFGGFMGLGDKLFAIPWRSLQIQNDDLVKLDIDKSQLEAATGFDQDHWPNMADRKWATETHRRFNQQPYWDVDVDANEVDVDVDHAHADKAKTGNNRDNDMGRKANNNDRMVQALPVCKLSDVIGKTVENMQDENLGDIEDVVLDANRGQIAYAVVGAGGFLGMGEDLIAVPWDKLDIRVTNDDTDVRMATTKDELKGGPHFSKDQWPNADDKDYLIKVYTYYDTEPYWQSGKRVSDARNP